MKKTFKKIAAFVLLAVGSIAGAAILTIDKLGILSRMVEQPYRTLIRAAVLLLIFTGTALLMISRPKKETDNGYAKHGEYTE